MSSIWIDINYGYIEMREDGLRVEHPELKERVEITSPCDDLFAMKKELLRLVLNKFDEMQANKNLVNNKIKNIVMPKHESFKEVTEEELLEVEIIKKVDDKYLNNYGKYIKSFQRIVRTSND